MSVLTIIMKSGKNMDFTVLSSIVSGAIASEYEVRVYAMHDAVWALRKDVFGLDNGIKSYFDEYSEMLSQALKEEKIINWTVSLKELKKIGKLKISACALVNDVTGLKKDDFVDLIDEITGITSLITDIEESDHTITI